MTEGDADNLIEGITIRIVLGLTLILGIIIGWDLNSVLR